MVSITNTTPQTVGEKSMKEEPQKLSHTLIHVHSHPDQKFIGSITIRMQGLKVNNLAVYGNNFALK